MKYDKCVICGIEFGNFAKHYPSLDGDICQDCANKMHEHAGRTFFADKYVSAFIPDFKPVYTPFTGNYNFANYSASDLFTLEKLFFKQNNFTPTKIIPFESGKYPKRNLYIDDISGSFYMPSFVSACVPLQIIKFKDINEISIVEDKSVISSSGSGAFVGAMLGGVTGAIIGASAGTGAYCRYMNIEIFTKLPDEPRISIPIIIKNTEKLHVKYINAKRFVDVAFAELKSRVIAVQEKNNRAQEVPQNNDFITQLEKLGQLKMAGLLTDEEFNQAKQKLLK